LERFVRSPDLLICWDEGRFLVEDLAAGNRIGADLNAIAVLDAFDRPCSRESAAERLPGLDRKSVFRCIRELRKLRWLLNARESATRVSRLQAWNRNLASAHYHLASRDLKYAPAGSRLRGDIIAATLARRRPAVFKRYASASRLSLPRRPEPAGGPRDLDRVLLSRRTVRSFRRQPVPLDGLARILRMTWGQTGWIEGSPFGRLAAKTSPSGGGLHPIECYVLAWNVRGLLPGIYHYEAGRDELSRLRRGDFRTAAGNAASKQRWVERAAFLCVLTAVFERTLWKYRSEGAYRVLWLDAGHLAQTFCLVATSLGLGAFTTAALQDSYIEKLIGLDGIKEFPVYLCGAGVPSKKLL
jgi:SagB-type dehydrogenase family enzyme